MSHAKAIKTIQLLTSVGDKSPNSLYAERFERNIQGKGRRNSINDAWDGLLIAILTTQQRSTGRSNLVRDLLNSRALAWKIARKDPTSITRGVKGFNYNKRKRTYLRAARRWLLNNAKKISEHRLAIDQIPVDQIQERYNVEVEAADFLRKSVKGIGHKQSRNFWQYLGYTAWTIPFDSRILAILEAPPFFMDPELKYLEAEEQVIALCQDAETYPCLLDASLFDLEGLMRSYVGLPQH